MAAVPVKPYEGKEPYIFISYSHRDTRRVFPILKRLSDAGYRVWYDEGIDPGTEWPESIATHLANSTACIAFVSEASLLSQNCRREINFALSRPHIGFLSVMLEDAKMTPGVEMQLSTYQSLLMYKYPDEEAFFEKLCGVDLLAPCRRAQEVQNTQEEIPAASTAAPAAAPGWQTPVYQAERQPAAPAAKSKKPLIIGIAAAAVVAIAVLVIVLVTGGKNEGGQATQAAESAAPASETAGQQTAGAAEQTEAVDQTTQAPGTEGETLTAEAAAGTEEEPGTAPGAAGDGLSASLSDFTFRLDGVVYQLPLALSELTGNGWNIASGSTTDQTEVEAGRDEIIQLGKNGSLIYVGVHNDGDSPAVVADCPVFLIQISRSKLMDPGLFCVAKGIGTEATADEVLAAFGQDADYESGNGEERLVYYTGENEGTMFDIYPESPESNGIVISYTQKKTVAEATELSDDLADYTFMLDSVLYQLPFDFSVLMADGWTITSYGSSAQTMVAAMNYDFVDISRNGGTVSVSVYNNSGNARPLMECKVCEVEVEQRRLADASRFCLAGGITAFSAMEEVRGAFGEETELSSTSNTTSLNYGKGASDRTRFVFYLNDGAVENSKIEVSHRTLSKEPTVTSTEMPAYLATYQAPEALGEDLTSGILELEGDLYRMPAPVSAFLDNGWRFSMKPGYLVACGHDTARLERDGVTVEVQLKNLADVQTLSENCAVFRITAESEKAVTCTLPKGITFGTRKSVVEEEPDYKVDDISGHHNMYRFTDAETRLEVVLRVDHEQEQVYSISVNADKWPE